MIVILINAMAAFGDKGRCGEEVGASRATKEAPRANPKARVRTPRGRLHPRCRTNRRHGVSCNAAYACVTMETSRATRSSEANDSQNKLVKHAEWM